MHIQAGGTEILHLQKTACPCGMPTTDNLGAAAR